MLHQLWEDQEPADGAYLTFCLAGPLGDEARGQLSSCARLTWTVEASSHFVAMTRYYEHMGWGEYTTDFPDFDKQPYLERGWE